MVLYSERKLSECAVADRLNEHLFFSCCPLKLRREVKMIKEYRVS
jgi:hypothetical protein